MGSKNRLFAEGLAEIVEVQNDVASRQARSGLGVFAGRSNRLAEIASGSVVNRTHELVDPARCRMWAGHNRDYAELNEERCHDLIESIKAQGRQEVPAITRRVRDQPGVDFEVICGARRHWSISWLRAHNYPDFRFLVEVRELTDEEAFRLSDLENRAREDISDLERARDYLRALESYYDKRQDIMAQRINVTTSWLSRYLDLARLPTEILIAFANVHSLGIRHVMLLKPLLKPEDKRQRVFAEAGRIASERNSGGASPVAVIEIVRRLTLAADPPKKTGAPKRAGSEGSVVQSSSGKTLLKISRERGGLSLVLPTRSGASRTEIDNAIAKALDQHWNG